GRLLGPVAPRLPLPVRRRAGAGGPARRLGRPRLAVGLELRLAAPPARPRRGLPARARRQGGAVNRDELLQALDLAAKEAPSGVSDITISPASAPQPPASATALVLDEWALRRGRDLLAEAGRLKQTGVCEHAAADFHGCAFEPGPQLHEACVDPARGAFITAL